MSPLLITIAAFVSPFEADRATARELIGADSFVEVFCDAPLEVCEARDTTSLYARARTGEIRDVTGIGAPYEPPIQPEIVVRTDQLSLAQSCEQIIAALRQLGFLHTR